MSALKFVKHIPSNNFIIFSLPTIYKAVNKDIKSEMGSILQDLIFEICISWKNLWTDSGLESRDTNIGCSGVTAVINLKNKKIHNPSYTITDNLRN